MTIPSYEFTADQNDAIRRLAQRMGVVGKILLVLAALVALATVFGEGPRGDLISAVLMGLVGMWTIRAARWFMEVVETEGEDISHLMAALGELFKLYNLQFWVLIVSLGLLVLGVIFRL